MGRVVAETHVEATGWGSSPVIPEGEHREPFRDLADGLGVRG
jgi:hypothetical protein